MGQILSFLPIGGAGESYELPVLDENYPQDVTIMESVDGSATFNISIVTPGKPAEYTCQWYVDGKMVDGATSLSYTKTGLTAATTYNVYCEVTNKAGTVTSRVATLTVTSSKPVYTYGGTANLEPDGSYNYKMKFLTSGVLKFTNLGCFQNGIDVFCVGGGGGGSNNDSPADGGGGGGYTKTAQGISITANTNYSIVVGSGGGPNIDGGFSQAFNVKASGGYSDGDGGSGGGTGWPGLTDYNDTGGHGGSDGNDGTAGYSHYNGGKGQRSKAGPNGESGTTREFGESSGTLYSGGGGGKNRGTGGTGGGGNAYSSGGTNTGGGGGAVASGGSGIVIIRNHR